MHDILTIGAATRDVFLVSKEFKFIESSQFATGIGECVSLGSKIELDTILHTTGGGATNAATTFARLGFHTGIVCKVGDDSVGRDVILDLHQEGVDTTLISRVKKGTTGYSTLLTATSGERTVLVYRGVSATFTERDIPWNACAGKWMYMTSLGGNMALAKKIAMHGQKCGSALAWNPGSMEIMKGLSAFRSILPRVQTLLLNREEAEKLTKKNTLPGIFESLTHGDNIILVTDGSNGAYAHHKGKTYFAATRLVKAISRTGAGDAFGSGFIAGFIHSSEIETALAVGTLNAESVIQHVGAKAGILRTWPPRSARSRISIKRLS